MEERFEVDKKKVGFGSEIFIITDKETGVQYLHFRNAASGGLTPLLDSNGNPVVKKK
ncbi:DUF6440 family protein [Enterococcus sp. DIV0212c]|uniref:DUF6440 family protein n=1 Tax=Enterococcus sp. DIV0212c TaxID=2230867 RepID=UPI001A9BFCC5|nr:hypothetical protein [Enterococcus sp. DIV0212c]